MDREHVRCMTRMGWIAGASISLLGPGNQITAKIQDLSNRHVLANNDMLEEIKAEAAMVGIPVDLLEPPPETAAMIDSEEFYQKAIACQQEVDKQYAKKLQNQWFGG